ncbi:MAG: hypothetical protein ACREAB_00395 [Blastocatellia bacterium]
MDFAGFEDTDDFRRHEDMVSSAIARLLQDSALHKLLDIQPRRALRNAEQVGCASISHHRHREQFINQMRINRQEAKTAKKKPMGKL